MAEGNNFLDVGKLAEPVSKIIDAVRATTGVLYEPTRIRRKAAAEADAAVIATKAQIQAEELRRRAEERVRRKEDRRQKNIESIAQLAIDSPPPEANKEPVDQDWMAAFFEHAQDISNAQMQQVWAAILSGEVAKPGSFSLRALATVRTLQEAEAAVFSHLASRVWSIAWSRHPIILSLDRHDPTGMALHELHALQSVGLIAVNDLGGFSMNVSIAGRLAVTYFDRSFDVVNDAAGWTLPCGHAMLTPVGEELFNVAGARPDYRYMEAVLAKWRSAERQQVIETTNST